MAFGIINKSTPSADQMFSGEFMRTYQAGVDAQAKSLKKKKRKGLESKLRDTKSELDDNQQALLKKLLGESSLDPKWKGHTLK